MGSILYWMAVYWWVFGILFIIAGALRLAFNAVHFG